MELSVWLAFASASASVLLVPGPTVVLVLSYALSQGRQVALATAGGVALGDLIAMSASLAGLGALVMASATLFTALKWLGAGYLIYLGTVMLLKAGSQKGLQLALMADTPASEASAPRASAPRASARAMFIHAAVVTALNPKSIIFFIAFVPLFINAQAPLLPQFTVLIATFVTLAALNAFTYALLADQIRARLASPAVAGHLARFGGAVLIAMGIATAAFKRA